MEKSAEHKNKPTFIINRIEAGWISGCLNDGKTEFYFDYSSADGNFPSSLLEALLIEYGVLGNNDNLDLFGWSEPEVDEWQIKKIKDSIAITIKTFADHTQNAPLEETTHLEFNTETLLKDIIKAYKNTLWTYGLLGYKKSWWQEFPLAFLLKLMDFADKKNSITLEDQEMGIFKSPVSAENKYITELFPPQY